MFIERRSKFEAFKRQADLKILNVDVYWAKENASLRHYFAALADQFADWNRYRISLF